MCCIFFFTMQFKTYIYKFVKYSIYRIIRYLHHVVDERFWIKDNLLGLDLGENSCFIDINLFNEEQNLWTDEPLVDSNSLLHLDTISTKLLTLLIVG